MGIDGFMVIAVVTGWILTHIGGIVRLPYLYWGLWLIPIISILFLKDQPAEGMKISLKSLGVVFKNRDFLWFLFLVMIISIPHRMNDSFFGLYLHHLGASNSFVGWAFAASAGSEILVFVYIGKLLNKFHELALLGVIAIFYMFRWLSYALIASPIVITFLQLSHGITFAAFWSVAVLYPTKLIPDHMRSTGQSLLAAVFIGVAGILGGLVGGWIQELFSWSAMYLFGAATAAAAAILFFATHAYYLKRGTAADMDTFANNIE